MLKIVCAVFKGISFIILKGASFFSLIGGGAAARTNKWTKCCPLPYRLPSGFSANLTSEARSAELYGWDGWDGMDGWMGGEGIPKVSFNFFHFKIY